MQIKRPNLSRFTRKQKLIAGTVLAVMVGGSVVGGTIYTYIRVTEASAPLPTLQPHGDIPLQPLTTFADTLNRTIPDDAKPVNSHCPSQTGDWVAAENKKPGIASTPTDWASLHLYQESGSVLWVDRQSATCGDRIGIHASLYPTKADGTLDKTPRSFEVLRVGWYNGSGARMVWNSGPVKLKFRNTPTLKNANRTI